MHPLDPSAIPEPFSWNQAGPSHSGQIACPDISQGMSASQLGRDCDPRTCTYALTALSPPLMNGHWALVMRPLHLFLPWHPAVNTPDAAFVSWLQFHLCAYIRIKHLSVHDNQEQQLWPRRATAGKVCDRGKARALPMTVVAAVGFL